jgi:hypothetical protein
MGRYTEDDDSPEAVESPVRRSLQQVRMKTGQPKENFAIQLVLQQGYREEVFMLTREGACALADLLFAAAAQGMKLPREKRGRNATD